VREKLSAHASALFPLGLFKEVIAPPACQRTNSVHFLGFNGRPQEMVKLEKRWTRQAR
jgi:hypothetical protein